MRNSFVTLREARNLEKKKIRNGTFQWLESGAEDNYTSDLNLSDLNKIKIIPKNFNSIGSNKFNFKFFNKKIKNPFIIAPMGHQTQFHPKGELEIAKGMYNADIIGSFTTQGRHSFDQIIDKYKNINAIWQIFPFGDLEWIQKQIKSAEKNNAIAISICLDAPSRSHRYDDRETRYDAREFGINYNKIKNNPKYFYNYDWTLLKKIKKMTQLPVIPKGIMSKEDLSSALKNGADGLWISNHGGRFFNSGISTINFLYSIQKEIKKIKNKKIIIVDGGVRRGSDIIKYLCMGADIIAIGRPFLYGLISSGSLGVQNIYNILSSEFYNNCNNGGFKKIEDFNITRLSI